MSVEVSNVKKEIDLEFGQRRNDGATATSIKTLAKKDIVAALDALGSDLGDSVIFPRKRYEVTATRLRRGIVITWEPTNG